jgi:hypothetical protein
MVKPLWTFADTLDAGAALDALLSFTTTATDRTYGAYGRVGGSRVNRRTHDAVMVAAHVSGWGTPQITQGGLNNSAVKASAKTHDGLDVVDVGSRGRTRSEIFDFVEAGMDCGIIFFVRGTPWDSIDDGMVEHLHGVMVGAQHAHRDARAQIYSTRYGYAHGGGGLGGAPWYRWFGPARKPLVEWADSRCNPANGWRP